MTMIVFFAFIVSLVLLLALPAQAAEEENAEKQFELGLKYYNGDGVEQNYDRAIECLRKAAGQGHAEAQNILEAFGEEITEKPSIGSPSEITATQNAMADANAVTDSPRSSINDAASLATPPVRTVKFQKIREEQAKARAEELNKRLPELCKSGTAEEIKNIIRAGAVVTCESFPSAINGRNNPNMPVIKALLGEASAYVKNEAFGWALYSLERCWIKSSVLKDWQIVINAFLDAGTDPKEFLLRARLGSQVINANIRGSGILKRMEELSHQGFWKLCISGSLDDIRNSLRRGLSDINAKDENGDTPLMMAAAYNTPDVINALIDAGANDDENPKTGEMALSYAVRCNTPDAVKALLNAGAKDTSKDNRTIFWVARCDDDSETVKVLLDALPDLKNRRCKSSHTPLMQAARFGASSVIKALLDAGAAIDAKASHDYEGMTALMYAVEKYSPSNPDAINVLLDAEANVKIRNDKWDTALDMARENSNLEGTEVLSRLEQMTKNPSTRSSSSGSSGDETLGGALAGAAAGAAVGSFIPFIGTAIGGVIGGILGGINSSKD